MPNVRLYHCHLLNGAVSLIFSEPDRILPQTIFRSKMVFCYYIPLITVVTRVRHLLYKHIINKDHFYGNIPIADFIPDEDWREVYSKAHDWFTDWFALFICSFIWLSVMFVAWVDAGSWQVYLLLAWSGLCSFVHDLLVEKWRNVDYKVSEKF